MPYIYICNFFPFRLITDSSAHISNNEDTEAHRAMPFPFSRYMVHTVCHNTHVKCVCNHAYKNCKFPLCIKIF
jgi:hypothetical protein